MLDRSCVDLIWTTHGMLVADISMNQLASKCSILFKSVDNSIVTFINLIINKFCNTKRLSIVNVQKKILTNNTFNNNIFNNYNNFTGH